MGGREKGCEGGREGGRTQGTETLAQGREGPRLSAGSITSVRGGLSTLHSLGLCFRRCAEDVVVAASSSLRESVAVSDLTCN